MANVGRWLNENNADWAQLTTSEKREIRDFPILWAYFELRATNRQAGNDTIIEAVGLLRDYSEPQSVSAATAYFTARYLGQGEARARREALNLNHLARTIVDPFLNGEYEGEGEGEGEEQRLALLRLKACLLIIYRLRNNFLHGEKAVYGYSGQLENFRVSNRVLMSVIPLWPIGDAGNT